ncbi:MAG: TonB-dependent receptor [Pseudomonadota bacterium]
MNLKQYLIIGFGLFILMLGFASVSIAQDEPTSISVDMGSIEEEIYFAEDELVTGPSKREVKLSEAPANVIVITNEDIIQSGATCLAEVFRRVPGMDVIQISSAEDQVSMRGFAGPLIDDERIAIFIDGRTFYHEFMSGTVWTQLPVPLDDIKRIELIKGPMSSLYGNKAMLGIINIVTYEPEETRTLLRGGGGRFRMGTAQFINAGKFAEGYWYKVSGDYIRYDENTDFAGDGNTKAEETLALLGKFKMQPREETQASLTGGVTQSYGLIQFGGLSRWEERRILLDGKASNDFGKWGKLNFQSYWERHYNSSRDINMGSVLIDNVDAELRHSFSFDISHDIKNTLTYGLNYRFIDVKSGIISQSLHNFAGFMQDEFRFFDRVILTGGVRLDYQKDFAGLNTSAHGSVVFLAHPRYTLRLGFGTAFNNPNLIHYFLDGAQAISPFPNVILAGNRNLKAERILYFDLGNIIRPIDELMLRADFFCYRLNNMLTPSMQFVPPASVQVQFINDGGARAIGGEIGVEGEIFKWLTGYANWSYQDFKPINGNLNPTPNLANPKNKASAGLRGYWFDRRFSTNVDFNYVRHNWKQNGAINFQNTPSVRIDDLYLLNVRVAYWPIKDHLELAVAANNILNDDSPQVPALDPTFNIVLAEPSKFNIWGSVRYIF